MIIVYGDAKVSLVIRFDRDGRERNTIIRGTRCCDIALLYIAGLTYEQPPNVHIAVSPLCPCSMAWCACADTDGRSLCVWTQPPTFDLLADVVLRDPTAKDSAPGAAGKAALERATAGSVRGAKKPKKQVPKKSKGGAASTSTSTSASASASASPSASTSLSPATIAAKATLHNFGFDAAVVAAVLNGPGAPPTSDSELLDLALAVSAGDGTGSGGGKKPVTLTARPASGSGTARRRQKRHAAAVAAAASAAAAADATRDGSGLFSDTDEGGMSDAHAGIPGQGIPGQRARETPAAAGVGGGWWGARVWPLGPSLSHSHNLRGVVLFVACVAIVGRIGISSANGNLNLNAYYKFGAHGCATDAAGDSLYFDGTWPCKPCPAGGVADSWWFRGYVTCVAQPGWYGENGGQVKQRD